MSAQKVLCVLYDDPVGGFPPAYARNSIPTLPQYPDGQTLPTPSGIDFTRHRLPAICSAPFPADSAWRRSWPSAATSTW